MFPVDAFNCWQKSMVKHCHTCGEELGDLDGEELDDEYYCDKCVQALLDGDTQEDE